MNLETNQLPLVLIILLQRFSDFRNWLFSMLVFQHHKKCWPFLLNIKSVTRPGRWIWPRSGFKPTQVWKGVVFGGRPWQATNFEDMQGYYFLWPEFIRHISMHHHCSKHIKQCVIHAICNSIFPSCIASCDSTCDTVSNWKSKNS